MTKRTILFVVALLMLTACTHTTQIDGRQVTKKCTTAEWPLFACTEEWNKGGERDRADGPAYILRSAVTGEVIYEEWDKGGQLDRADGPAVIRHDMGPGIYEEWWKDGQEFWFKDGKPIDKDGKPVDLSPKS